MFRCLMWTLLTFTLLLLVHTPSISMSATLHKPLFWTSQDPSSTYPIDILLSKIILWFIKDSKWRDEIQQYWCIESVAQCVWGHLRALPMEYHFWHHFGSLCRYVKIINKEGQQRIKNLRICRCEWNRRTSMPNFQQYSYWRQWTRVPCRH